ncbi:YkyA family protein [Salinicoccus siamensis]|uniref:YkyA family protein n=1 Tax=Salinicoccus siamensis TaxID=381830 RepID=A0ABV5Z2B3_9STAP
MTHYIRYITGALLFLLLAGCGNPEDQLKSTIEQTDEVKAEITDSLQTLNDLDAKMQSVFTESLEDDTFNAEGSALADNHSKRADALQTVEDNTEAFISKQEELGSIELPSEDSKLNDDYKAVQDAYGTLRSHLESFTENYQGALDTQKSVFETLSSEDADFNALENGVGDINDAYAPVQKEYSALDEALTNLEDAHQAALATLEESGEN